MAKKISTGNFVETPKVVKETPVQSVDNFLTLVSGTVRKCGKRILLYGQEGSGKSTSFSKCEGVVFIPTEDGLATIDTKAFPKPSTWSQLLKYITDLTEGEHSFKTVVIDTIDMAHVLCVQYCCERDGKASIDDYGHGRGYGIVATEWRNLLIALEELRNKKDMNIGFTGHTKIKKFENPSSENYDRWELSVDSRVAQLTKDWCDAVLFLHHEVYVKESKAYCGDRALATSFDASYDAKNRYGWPHLVSPFEPTTLAKLIAEGE